MLACRVALQNRLYSGQVTGQAKASPCGIPVFLSVLGAESYVGAVIDACSIQFGRRHPYSARRGLLVNVIWMINSQRDPRYLGKARSHVCFPNPTTFVSIFLSATSPHTGGTGSPQQSPEQQSDLHLPAPGLKLYDYSLNLSSTRALERIRVPASLQAQANPIHPLTPINLRKRSGRIRRF